LKPRNTLVERYGDLSHRVGLKRSYDPKGVLNLHFLKITE